MDFTRWGFIRQTFPSPRLAELYSLWGDVTINRLTILSLIQITYNFYKCGICSDENFNLNAIKTHHWWVQMITWYLFDPKQKNDDENVEILCCFHIQQHFSFYIHQWLKKWNLCILSDDWYSCFKKNKWNEFCISIFFISLLIMSKHHIETQ
jgi:hypothetical protein